MKKLLLIVVLAASVSLLPIGGSQSVLADGQSDQDIPFQMLAVNDFHGNLNTVGEFDQNGKTLKVGGAGYLATHLNQAEQDFKQQSEQEGLNPHTLRIEAGDLVGGSPPVSALLQDQPTVAAFNAMNFKVASLGNHEFDEGMKEFHRLLSASSVHPKVKKYTKGFDYHYHGIDDDFDFMAANVVDKKTQEPIFPPYTIQNVGGVKVGFIGVDTTEIPNIVLKKNTKDYDFLDPAETVNKYAKELQSKGVHAIVVVGHVAAYQDDDNKITGTSANIAKNTIDDVDIIISGHSHTQVNGFVNGKLITQARKYGEAYGDIRTELDPQTNDFVMDPDHKNRVNVDAQIRPNTRDVTPDSEIQKFVDQAQTITSKVTNSTIGYTKNDQPILKDHPNDGEWPLGDLTTDSQRVMTGADFALNNSGSIRLPLIPETNDQGEHVITWGAAFGVQPFENMLGVYQLTGAQIKEGINQQWSGAKGFLQLSGFRYTYANGKKASDCDQSNCIQDMYLPDGSKMDMDQTYSVAMNKFLADGGDGYTALAKGKLLKEHDLDDTHTFINYLKELTEEGKKINPKKEGRAVLVHQHSKDLKNLVSQLSEEKEITNDQAVHALQMHLTAVNYYENHHNTKKVIRHMKGFKKLLLHQKNNDFITTNAYETLKLNADYMIQTREK